MFWKLLLIVVLLGAFGLAAYALYLRSKVATGKGRFAAAILFAIVSTPPAMLFAVSQIRITDNVLLIVGLLTNNEALQDYDGPISLSN